MIGVVAGSGIGGFATPIGCATNLLGLEMVTSLTGKTVSFMEYTAVGYPIMLVTLTVLWLILTTIFKVEPLDEKAIGAAETLPPMTAKEKKGVLIIIAMIVCWFLGSWVTVLNGTAVAALGAILLLMPGIEVIDWKGLNSVISWDILLCCGAIQPLVIAIANADGPTWLVNNFLSVVDGMPMILLTFIMCLIAVGLHVIIPSGGPIITLLGVPYISMFVALGYNPVIAIMLTTFGCGMALILPYDGLVLMAKPYGYFTVGEYVKQGIVNSAVLCVVMTVMVVILGGIFLPAF